MIVTKLDTRNFHVIHDLRSNYAGIHICR